MAAATTFTPSPAESTLVSQIFAHADPNKLGAITGDVAVKVFGGANLSPLVLGEIWQIADEANNGWLATQGTKVSAALLSKRKQLLTAPPVLTDVAGPLPTIAGITPVAPQRTGSSASRAKSPQPGLPPFTPQDKVKFQNLFIKSGPIDGLLSSEKAQEIFLKSKLPNETLGLIWNLADTQDRGKLDSTDFAIGMYLIQAAMTGHISSIPNSLPPGFYQQVAQSALHSQTTGGAYSPLASSFSQRSTLQPQYTGASQHILQPQTTGPWSSKPPVPPHLPARPTVSAPGASIIGTGAFGQVQPHWDITPTEKATSDRWFDSLDTQKRGYIQDDVAVPFMLESKLSGEDLAQIWDLADINNDGRLTRDGFAIAWYLIQKKRTGVPIPASLPHTLIPPSMRGGAVAPPASSAPQESQRDLFSWDDPLPTPQTAPAPAPFSVQQRLSPQPTAAFSSPPRSDPFGSSNAISPAPAADLLGDDEDTTTPSPPIHDKSAEIGNAQNQVNSTSRSLAAAQAERQTLETTLANQAAQLSALQTQLSTAKAAYETENKLLAGLRERHATQTAEMQKTQEELIRAESDLSAVRVEKAEIEGSFLRDKEEARGLHKKMVEAGQHMEMLKVDIEKSKKEAKQQKGLLAIARKQLSSKEAERAKVEKELQEAQAEAAGVASEKDHIDASIAALDAQPMPTAPVAVVAPPPERTTSSDSLAFAAGHTLPASPAPDAGSPSLASSIKSNNPFDRLMGNSTPRSQSPFAPGSNPISPEASLDAAAGDPFGFARAFDADEVPETATPKPELAPSPNELMVDDSATSESDVFSTPLTSSAPVFPAIDDVVAASGETERSDSHPPGHFEPEPAPAPAEADTHLGTQLKDLDVEESDIEPSFDDVFGVSTPAPQPSATPAAAEPLTDAFGMPVSDANGFAPQPTVAGVNAFDEAMGKIPVTSAPTQFNAFDSAFDDNFDFAAASGPVETTFPPPPALNGHAVSPLPPSASKNEFDNIFASTSPPVKSSVDQVAAVAPVIAPQPVPATNGVAKPAGPSFEEAFAGFDSGQETQNLGASLDKSTSGSAQQQFPATSPTSSPKSTAPSQGASRRSVSPPPRHRSPPPPRGGLTKGTIFNCVVQRGKDQREGSPPTSKLKAQRKLFVYPLARKRTKTPSRFQRVPLISSHLLKRNQRERRRPAVEDDVEAVKQLTAMGFSRSQAVDALEIHGYDVPKALNSLLGAQ
ncbi:hypothetical protein C8F01DRAFT_1100205 [Mycena amicta]|nr:hypothetical protein C8F01DRAFT_1100205 [Mycena amicta]